MKTSYLKTKTTVSLCRYHFVFCPYKRRRIFDIPCVEDRFKEVTRKRCAEDGFEIIAMECHHDHVHMFLSAPPQVSPSDIMKIVKGYTSHVLRNEFPALSRMSSLWTRSFFVSTAGDVSAATIKRYVDAQKTR